MSGRRAVYLDVHAALVLTVLACCAAVRLPALQRESTRMKVADGAIAGSLRDTRGGALPEGDDHYCCGERRRTVVADSAGLYELSGLPVGAYRLTVALAGFVTAIRTDTFVLAPQRTRVDFTLCAAALEHIDWVVPPDLAALWAQADVVAKFIPPLAGRHRRCDRAVRVWI
jgi:hypothetical protein